MSDTDNKSNIDVSAHPGAILKAAREESPYSLDQVAEALHLRSSVVQAMEQEKYQEFDSEVFLKGYYRSYCRLVGLHEERMVELLERQLAAHRADLAEEAAEVERARLARKRKKLSRYIAVIIVVGLIGVLVVMAALGPENDVSDKSGSSEVQSPVTTDDPVSASIAQLENSDANGLDTGAGESTGQPTSDAEELSGTSRVVDESPVESAPFAEKLQDDREQGLFQAPTGISELQAQEQLEERRLESDPADEDSSVPDTDVSPEAIQVVDASLVQASLKISFSGDCWLQVLNGAGKTPIARLQRAGDEVSYQGPKPFRVVLGDARVASLNFEGKDFDLGPYIRSNGRAEFVLE